MVPESDTSILCTHNSYTEEIIEPLESNMITTKDEYLLKKKEPDLFHCKIAADKDLDLKNNRNNIKIDKEKPYYCLLCHVAKTGGLDNFTNTKDKPEIWTPKLPSGISRGITTSNAVNGNILSDIKIELCNFFPCFTYILTSIS